VVKAARAALAVRLRDLRAVRRWTQLDVAVRTQFSRSTVARAERAGECSRDFLARADALYGTEGDELAKAHDRIEALRAGARVQSPQPAPVGSVTAQEEATVAYAALEAACPHCHKPVAIVMEQTAALVTVETASGP
jgi:hypothetical protein